MRKRKFRRSFKVWLIVVGLLFPIAFMLFAIHIGNDQKPIDNTEEGIEFLVESPIETEIYVPKDEEIVEEPDIEEDIFVPAYEYTEEDLDLLARLIYSEGGIESYEVKLMIGSVVLNRMSDPDPNFPDTLREVIYQKNQFSVTTIKMDGVIMIDRPADEESIRAAKELLDYGSVLPEKVQVFYAKSVKKGWVTTREPYGTYGRTVFAYIYPKGEIQ